MRIIFVLSLILACFTRTSSQSSILGPTNVCEFECHSYTFDGPSPAYWTVIGGLVESNQGAIVEICWEESQNGSISISGFDPNQIEAQLAVMVNPIPDPKIYYPLYPECQQDSLMQKPNGEFGSIDNCRVVCGGSLAFYDAIGFNNSTFSWDIVGATSVNQIGNGVEVLWPDEGFGSITLIEETDDGCIESSFSCIEILEKPNLSIIHVNNQLELSSVCQNQNIYLEAQSDQGADFQWLSSDGQSISGSLATFSFQTTGTYTIELIAITECICEVRSEITINVIDFVSPIIECIGTVCPGTEATYYAGDVCAVYDWQISGNGSIIEGGAGGDNFLTVNWGNGPTGVVSLTTSSCDDLNICTQAAIEIVPIMDPNTSIQGPIDVCSNQKSAYYVPNLEGTSFNWTISGGNGVIISGQGSNEINVAWQPTYWAGSSTALIEVEMDNCFLGCQSDGSLNVNIKDEFEIGLESEYCEEQTAYFQALSGYNSAQVDWTLITPNGDVLDIGQATDFISTNLDHGAGYYELYATDNSGTFCNQEYRTGFIVHPNPEAVTEIIGPEFVCSGQAYEYKVQLLGDNYAYDWTISDGGNSSKLLGTEVFVEWLSTGPYTLTVELTNLDTGCRSEEFSKTFPEVGASNIVGDNIVCEDSFSDYELMGIEGIDIDWSTIPETAGTILVSSDNDATVQWHAPGIHMLQAEYCGNIFDLNITVTDYSYSVSSPESLCLGELGQITVSPPTNGSFRVYNEIGAYLGNSNPVMVGPGFYGIEVFDVNGCKEYTNAFIDSNEAPAVNVSSRELENLCIPGTPTEFEALATVSGLTYQWLFNGVPIGGNSPKVSITEPGNLLVEVEDVNGCQASYSIEADCTEGRCECRPDGGVSFDAFRGARCNDFDFTNTSPSTFIPGSIRYNFGDPDSGAANTTADENPSHTFSKAGHFPVVISGTVPDASDPTKTCPASFLRFITVEMVADFDYTPGCVNDLIDFRDNTNFLPDFNIGNYAWDFGDPSSGADNISSGALPAHNFSSAGTFEVTLTVTSTTGCTTEIKKSVIVHDGPTLDYTYSNTTCTNEAMQFFGTGSAPLVGWDFDDTPNRYSVSQNALHHFQAAGLYDVTFLGENVYGCRTEVIKTIEVFDNNLSGEITMDQTMPLCIGESVNLAAPANGIAYLWSTGETLETIAAGTAGIYTVTVTSVDGCEYIPEAVIVNTIQPINPVIRGYLFDPFDFNPTITYNELEICSGDIVELYIGFIPNSIAYEWSTGDTGSSLNVNQIGSLAVGEHEFTVTVTHGPTGCKITSDPFKIIVHPLPESPIIAHDQPDDCEGPEFTFTISNPEADVRYFWSNGKEGTTMITSTPGQYHTVAVNEFGCSRMSNTQSIYALPNIDRMFTGCQEVCFPETLCVADAPESTNYQWFVDGSPIPGPAGTMSTLEINNIGEYQVMLENNFGCTSMSDVLSITPETKEQTLSGVVFVDDNGNGAHDPTEMLVPNVPVNIFSGGTVHQVTTTDANGYYSFDPLTNSDAMVVIDPSGLGFDIGQSILFYDFELKSCLEDLIQDFPLILDCNGNAFDLTLFTCPDGEVEYENVFYNAGDTAEVITTDINGCQSTVNLTVEEFVQETYQLSTENTCANMDMGVLTISANTNSGLEFSIDDGSSYTSDLSFENLTPGSYTLTVSDMNGCISLEPFEILELQEPDVTIATEKTCEDEATGTIVISNNSSSNLEFAVDDPSSMTQLTSINNLSGGNHTLYIVDGFGCSYEYPFSIDTYDIPVINITTQETCQGEPFGAIEIDNPASANVEYAINDLSNTTSNTIIQDLPEGDHTLYIIDENGCTTSQEFIINAYTIPELTFVESPTCSGEINGSLNIATSETGLEFSTSGSDFSSGLEIFDLEAGDQILYIQNQQNCIFEVDFSIQELGDFSIDFNAEKACIGLQNGTIELLGNSNLNYSLDGGSFQAENIYTDLAAGDYIVTAVDENGCTDELEISIAETQPIDIEFSEPDINCSTIEVELSSIVDDPSQVSFEWNTGESSESIVVNQSGLYEVIIDDGCTTREKEWEILFDGQHEVNNPAFVPNVFDPTATDGNQECRPYINQDIELLDYRFSIYDRWGNKMFDSTDHSEYWDGVFNSQDVDPGVFVWRIDMEYTKCAEPIKYQKFGDITLYK